jgi:hypothetical protein
MWTVFTCTIHAEHTRNEFYRTLSIRGTNFIARRAYAEPIASHAEHARKCLKVEYLGRIEYDFQKSRVTGPWNHMVSVSTKKSFKKISCLCNFKGVPLPNSVSVVFWLRWHSLCLHLLLDISVSPHLPYHLRLLCHLFLLFISIYRQITVRCASPISMKISLIVCTWRKRKYVEEKTTAKLKDKQTSIVSVPD